MEASRRAREVALRAHEKRIQREISDAEQLEADGEAGSQAVSGGGSVGTRIAVDDERAGAVDGMEEAEDFGSVRDGADRAGDAAGDGIGL